MLPLFLKFNDDSSPVSHTLSMSNQLRPSKVALAILVFVSLNLVIVYINHVDARVNSRELRNEDDDVHSGWQSNYSYDPYKATIQNDDDAVTTNRNNIKRMRGILDAARLPTIYEEGEGEEEYEDVVTSRRPKIKARCSLGCCGVCGALCVCASAVSKLDQLRKKLMTKRTTTTTTSTTTTRRPRPTKSPEVQTILDKYKKKIVEGYSLYGGDISGSYTDNDYAALKLSPISYKGEDKFKQATIKTRCVWPFSDCLGKRTTTKGPITTKAPRFPNLPPDVQKVVDLARQQRRNRPTNPPTPPPKDIFDGTWSAWAQDSVQNTIESFKTTKKLQKMFNSLG